MDFTNVRTESQSGPSSLRGRAGGGRTQASQWQEQCSAESTPPPGCLPAASELGGGGPWQAARAPLLTFASVWQCPHDPCSLGSYPDKGANSQLMGTEAGVI